MSGAELREMLRSPGAVESNAFRLLHQIACLVNDPAQEELAHEMVLRALEHRQQFGAYRDVLDSLVQAVGLYPYMEPDTLGFRSAVAFEFHRPENMGDEFVFHREQAEVYRRLLNGDSVILSAPTSFGKSRIIDALIATERYRNIAIIVPTLSLIDETRRRLSAFSGRYKLITHLSQRPADANIFVLTAERAVAYEYFTSIDFFAIDEFYKLDDAATDTSRTIALNQAFYNLRRLGGQFYLLGPNIERIPDGLEKAFRCHFYPTKFTTVASEQVVVPGKGDDLHRLVSLCKGLDEPTLIFCKSPARVNEVARALVDGLGAPVTLDLRAAAAWAARNYHPEWIYGNALLHGVGIHHGRLPRALAQYTVRMFNDLRLRFLVCTSTLIEGVNTKAKNVVVFDNKIARQEIDFFTFSNIKGRSGRMFEHFVGHVYLFDDPPAEKLPFVDFPLFSQQAGTPDGLLVQIDAPDLKPSAQERVQRYIEQDTLPISVIRANSGIEPDAQLQLARHLGSDIERWSRLLSWTWVPTTEQLAATCDLIWTFFVRTARGKGGVYSGRQLAFKTWQLRRVRRSDERVRQELRQGQYAAKTPDEAVERVLDFERTWAAFELPRYLMALSRIQAAVLGRRGLPVGDFAKFASEIECQFTSPVVAALDEFGLPYQVGVKLSAAMGDPASLDDALALLRQRTFQGLDLDEFERELLADAIEYLPGLRKGMGAR